MQADQIKYMEIKSFLKQTFFFESLSQQQIEVVAAAASQKEIHRGEHLFVECQLATAFFVVVSNLVKIYKLSADGNEQILHVQESGDLIAEAIIFEFDTYPAYCQALEDTTLIRISREKFIEVLRCYSEISFQIMRAYARRIRQLVNKIEEISLHDVRSRLANYLLNNGRELNGQYFCELKISKKDLAAILGTIPETLSRVFQIFKKEKIIAEDKEKIIVLDFKRLKAFSF